MVNISQSEDNNEELKLSPLGTDEINLLLNHLKIQHLMKKNYLKKMKKTL